MKQGSDDLRIACCLTGAELRERDVTLLAQFRSDVIEAEELWDGYAFRLPGDCTKNQLSRNSLQNKPNKKFSTS